MIRLFFTGDFREFKRYKHAIMRACAARGLQVELTRHCQDPAEVDYIVLRPGPRVTDFTPFVNCKAVLSLWAGVESVVDNPTLTPPLTRMVDNGLKEGMVEYVVAHTLRYHIGMDQYLGATDWAPVVPPLARKRAVTVLGLGELGLACAEALAALNFQVTGWSRRAKELPGITCLSGDEGLTEALRRADILVLLLPLTEATEGLLNADTLSLLPDGARLINPGRGPLIVDEDLLSALETGPVGHATLDVFHEEPLPAAHPFWGHEKVTITPHIASATRPSTSAEVIAENVRRSEEGEPLLYVVDRGSGY